MNLKKYYDIIENTPKAIKEDVRRNMDKLMHKHDLLDEEFKEGQQAICVSSISIDKKKTK